MTPDAPKVLGALAGALAMQVLPEVRTPFGQQSVGLAATLLVLLAQDYDRAPACLAEENLSVRHLLRRAEGLPLEHGLRARIAELETRPSNPDLRISALTRENNELRGILVDVHAAVETIGGTEASAVDEAIWEELRKSTQRRHLEGGLGG